MLNFQENGMAFFMQAPYGSRWPSWLNDGLGQSWARCEEQMLDLSTQMKKCDIKSPYSEEHMYILTNNFPMQWRLTDSLKKSLKVNCEELLNIHECQARSLAPYKESWGYLHGYFVADICFQIRMVSVPDKLLNYNPSITFYPILMLKSMLHLLKWSLSVFKEILKL